MRDGRPPSPNSKTFYRVLSMPDKLILNAAGQGNVTHGFHHVISCYQILWNRGYRPEADLDEFLNELAAPKNKALETL